MNPEESPLLRTPSESDHNYPLENRPSGGQAGVPRNSVQFNIRAEMNSLMNRSLTLNLLRILFSSLKILITALMLGFYPKKCSQPIEIWLILNMSIDGLYIISIIIIIYYARRIVNDVNRRRNGAANANNNRNNFVSSNVERNFEQQQLDDIEQNQSNYDFIRNFEEDNRYFSWFREGIRIYYIIILVWGHVLLFIIENDCKEKAPGLTLLVLIFLIFGYFYLFYPVFIVLAICLCLPVLIIAAFYFGGRGQEPANNEAIEKLPRIKFFKKNYQENNCNCVICQTDFQEDEEVIKLPCPNADHIFHYECVARWLKINGICPICRNKI